MAIDPPNIRRAWVDPAVRPEAVAWFQLHDGRTGRLLGMFMSLPEARRWVLRRPPTERFRLVLYLNGRATARWVCRSAFGGQVKGMGDFCGGSNRGE
jgi:hypothetical protein